jgi:hypothetical protein
MERKIALITAALIAVFALRVNARDASLENLSAESIKNDSLPSAAPSPSHAQVSAADEREWLVMVFVNGRNNLWQHAVADINEMEMAGSSGRVAVTAELGLPQDRGNSARFYVMKDTTPAAGDRRGPIISPAMKVPGADMGSWKHFVDFAKWSYANYPAKKVLAIIWNHGSGRIDIGGADNAGSELGIAYDELTRNFIRNKQLALAFREIESSIGKKVSIYASDACLMQMASVAYEIKGSVELIVGSEEIIPNDGFPYDAILRELASDPAMNSEALGSLIVNDFSAYYRSTDKNTALSAVKASKLPEFTRLLNDWVRAAAVPPHRKIILEAENEALAFEKGYTGPDTSHNARSKDLYDFIDLMGAKADKSSVLYARSAALKDFIVGRLVLDSKTTQEGGDYDRAHGLAVYFPKLIYDASYDETLFARDSLWDDFLKWKLDPSYAEVQK